MIYALQLTYYITLNLGPANASGTWGGVLGRIINGDYQLCLSFWTHTADRMGMLDFVVMGKTISFVLAFIPKPQTFDTLLFIRPFRNEVWVVTGIAGTLISLFLISTSLILKQGERNEHLRIAVTVWWLSYLIIRYYFSFHKFKSHFEIFFLLQTYISIGTNIFSFFENILVHTTKVH